MGFFSLPMAKMVGPGGKVFCIDLQEKMIHKLYKRAKKKNLQKQIEARVCRKDSLNVRDINNSVDFILASAVVHEVPDSVSFFTELYRITAEDGRLLVIEPGNRVSLQDFRTTVETAVKSGFYLLDKSGTRNKHTALFGKTPH
jgi:ubiquinone/menaquinone biosynthesis C-methylase UbiE